MDIGTFLDFTAKVALVTGAGRGIGATIAKGFARAGADVVVADLDQRSSEQTASCVMSIGRKSVAIKADVGDAAQVNELFEVTRREFGRLDILVNNAGIWFRKSFLEISESEWDLVLTTNLKGTFLCVQKAAQIMIPQAAGCIINIASHAGLFYSRGQGVHYAASKAAIIQLTRVLAFELGPFQIRINAIAPGGTNTSGITNLTPNPMFNHEHTFGAQAPVSNPLSRKGEPEDIAQAALFLASPMASFITGQTLVVNGGSMGSV